MATAEMFMLLAVELVVMIYLKYFIDQAILICLKMVKPCINHKFLSRDIIG